MPTLIEHGHYTVRRVDDRYTIERCLCVWEPRPGTDHPRAQDAAHTIYLTRTRDGNTNARCTCGEWDAPGYVHEERAIKAGEQHIKEQG